jgi:hypothetical protein
VQRGAIGDNMGECHGNKSKGTLETLEGWNVIPSIVVVESQVFTPVYVTGVT